MVTGMGWLSSRLRAWLRLDVIEGSINTQTEILMTFTQDVLQRVGEARALLATAAENQAKQQTAIANIANDLKSLIGRLTGETPPTPAEVAQIAVELQALLDQATSVAGTAATQAADLETQAGLYEPSVEPLPPG